MQLMNQYFYRALNKSGVVVEGFVIALNHKEARNHLRTESLELLSMKSSKFSVKSTDQPTFLLNFTQQLKQLIESGLPIYESLLLLKDQSSSKLHKSIFSLIVEDIRKGSSFSKALELHPNFFDKRTLAIFKAAEASGFFLNALKELSDLLEKEIDLKKKIITSLLYPGLLFLVGIIVTVLLLIFVVPSIEILIEGKDSSLITNVVLFLSAFFRHHFLLIALSLTISIGCIIYNRNKLFKSRVAFDFYFKIPFVKNLLVKTKLALFFRTLSSLQKGGVALIESLDFAKSVLRCPPLEEIIEKARKSILEGRPLSYQFKRSNLIPIFIKQMLAIAEETGTFGQTFEKIADFYEKDAQKNFSRLAIILQPIILIFLAIIVGFIMLALLLPLTDVSNWMG